MLTAIVILLATVILDQVTKALAVSFLCGEPSVSLIGDFLRLTYTTNPGAAWGMLSGHRWVFMLFSSIFILAVLGYLFYKRPKSIWLRVALSLIAGGGIGNMIDRVRLEYVVDFIDVTLYYPKLSFSPFSLSLGAYDFPVFNGADSFVCVGAGILAVWLIVDTVREARKEKRERQNGDPNDDL